MNKTKKYWLTLGLITAVLSLYILLNRIQLKDRDAPTERPEELYSGAKSSVVKLYSLSGSQALGTTSQARSGTGFKTYLGGPKIVTNKHVVENQGIIIAESEQDTWIIKSWVEHPVLDIALLDVEESKIDTLKPLKVNTEQIVHPGQKIYTIGYPLGLGLAIHHGLISTTDKGKIVFSAPLSEGASGSPLLNERGEVIGICDSFIPNAQNYNLATPASLAFLTNRWLEKKSSAEPELEEYILQIASVKKKIQNKQKEWNDLVESSPEWKPWVDRTMVTRRPTDEAIQNMLLTFAAVEWASINNPAEKDYRTKEAKLLQNSTLTLQKIWEIHKDNLLVSKELKPNPKLNIDIGVKQTEDLINATQTTATSLLEFLSRGGIEKDDPAGRKGELRKLLSSIGNFRECEANYYQIGTP